MGRLLSPDNLARDFTAGAELARRGVGDLYRTVLGDEPPQLQPWKTLFGNACGYDPDRPSAGVARLARLYGTAATSLRPDALLFAVQTYYAILVRLLVGRALAGVVDGGLLGDDLFPDDPFSWYESVSSARIERLTGQLAARLAEYDAAALRKAAAGGSDPLGQLYQGLFPGKLRHILGEYYTPGWLADHVLDASGYSGEPQRRLLDPACGSGTFLIRAIRRIRAACRIQATCDGQPDRRQLCRNILAGVVGFDLNPLAVITARANYLIAVADLLPHAGRVEIPVHLCDSILTAAPSAGRFDFLVGNPPWIAWDNLPDDYRRATRPLWERYGLFSLSGSAGRHGGAKKDLSMLMLYATADRYLTDGGRLAMVITQTLFQTKGAGDGFRRFRLGPEGPCLKVVRVDDLTAVKPFPDAANFTSTIVLEKGTPTRYPVPYVKWSPDSDGQEFTRRTYQAEPIDRTRPGSPWFLRPEGLTTELHRLVGPSGYTAYLGANSGGANGVYWLEVLDQTPQGVLVRNLPEKGKRTIEAAEQVIEPDLLYPLVRWGDVGPFRARPSAHILLAQDPATRTGIDQDVMRKQYPRTYAYLKRFEPALTRRAAYRRYQGSRPFYSMYNVGPYTVAPIKVVWRRMDRRIRAAVIEQLDDPLLGPRPLVPQETCVLIELDSSHEAHYVCAVLNSSIVNFLVTSHSVRGGKGFGTPSLLDFIRLGRFDPTDPRHTELSTYSRRAHAAVTAAIQNRIDELVGRLWGLDRAELEAIITGSDLDY